MQPQPTGNSGGTGLILLLAVGLMIAGAIYFANFKNVDFPGSQIIRNLTGADTNQTTQPRQSHNPQTTQQLPIVQLNPTVPPLQTKTPTTVPNLARTPQPTPPTLSSQNSPNSTPAVIITRVQSATPDRTDLTKLANARWIKNAHRESYDRIANFPWVQDGLSQHEGRTAENLFYIAADDHNNLAALLNLNWLDDGITPSEAKVVQWLKALNHLNPPKASALLNMPFMKSITETDALLVKGMFSRRYRGAPGNILQYPTAIDGITDDETTLLTAATTSNDEAQIRRLLTPGGATVETIQTATARTPTLKLSIIRAGDRTLTDTTKILEEAITYVENTMGMSLPTNHVILLLDDSAVYANFAGVNYGHAIAAGKQSEHGTNWDKQAFKALIVHEVAHYFWHGSQDWIDEGVADAIEITYAREHKLAKELQTSRQSTCTITTLQNLAKTEHHRDSPQFRCNYYLGANLFLELLDAHGKADFTQGLQNLYAITRERHYQRLKAGIEDVKAAFGHDNPVVIKHWTGHAPSTVTVTRIEPTKTGSQPTPTRPVVASVYPTPTPALIVVTRINISTPAPTSPPVRITRPTPTRTPQPTPTPTPDLQSFMQEGIRLHEAGQHQAALEQFKNYRILTRADTSELKLWQGRAHRGLGDLETALRHLDIAVYLDDNAINLAERAGIHADMGNGAEALEDGYDARNSPDQTDGWRHSKAEANLAIARGWALIWRWEESRNHAEEALEVATDHGYREERIRVIRTVLEEAERQLVG